MAYYFIIELTYLPAFSAFVSNFYHLQTFSAVAFQHFQHWSAIFSYFQQFQPFSAVALFFLSRLTCLKISLPIIRLVGHWSWSWSDQLQCLEKKITNIPTCNWQNFLMKALWHPSSRSLNSKTQDILTFHYIFGPFFELSWLGSAIFHKCYTATAAEVLWDKLASW